MRKTRAAEPRSPDSASHRADIAIVGAGPVGIALGLALMRANAGLDVVIVGDPDAGSPAPGRAIALSRGAIAMLEVLGVWPVLAPQAQPMERVVVTDGKPGGSQLSLLEFAAEPGSGASAHLVEDPDLAAGLAQVVRQTPGLSFLAADRPLSIEPTATAATIRFASGMELTASLMVGADGRGSGTRAAAGIRTVGWTYSQAGLVAVIEHSKPHHGVAVERFLPAGPFAILPLKGNRSSIVWTETEVETGRLINNQRAFNAALEQRFGGERGEIREVGPVSAFPLGFHIARQFVGPRMALIGDAAHVVHPLAGQGLNLGLRDVAALAQAVVEARRLGLDIGSVPVLERYERWRRFDIVTSALTYDGLNRLFSNDADGVRALRDLGLGMVDRIPALKRVFLREAAGLTGVVPRLMTGEVL